MYKNIFSFGVTWAWSCVLDLNVFFLAQNKSQGNCHHAPKMKFLRGTICFSFSFKSKTTFCLSFLTFCVWYLLIVLFQLDHFVRHSYLAFCFQTKYSFYNWTRELNFTLAFFLYWQCVIVPCKHLSPWCKRTL